MNKVIFVIELNPLQSVVKSGHQALHCPRTFWFLKSPHLLLEIRNSVYS